MKRVAIYARTSTSRCQKPEVQIMELKNYCKARGWDVCIELVDKGYKGKQTERPGLKELMRLVRERQVDVVCIWRLDRLFRSLKHIINTLDEFSALGIEFVSLKDHFDDSPTGMLLLAVTAAFAEFENNILKERTHAGLDYAVEQGKKLGRPYSNDYDEIRQLREQGLTYNQIQLKLGVSKGAVCRALQSPRNGGQNDDL